VLVSVGHSNHPIEHFLDLLKRLDVEAVADTRSQPYSRFSPQYDQASLKEKLESAGIRYVYIGQELGGRPEGREFYDAGGHVLYGKVAESDGFKNGLARLERGMRQYRTLALLCSEENPSVCHRRLLITRVLAERGIEVYHLRGDGRMESESELRAAERPAQLGLFEQQEFAQQDTWKSIPSVLPKKRRGNSLKPSEEPVFAGSSTFV
jgi:uncharacterized protein (DUF488 family)